MFPYAGLLLFVIGGPLTLCAQDQSTKPLVSHIEQDCSQELFEKAEDSFQLRWRDTENLWRAERELSGVVRLCADAPGGYPAQEHLKVVHEELAEKNLSIALFYLKRYANGKGALAALSRLKNVVERYPEYSKLDQVLSLLGQLNVADGNLDDANGYYQRIVKDFPASQSAGEASIQVCVIDAMRNVGKPVLQP